MKKPETSDDIDLHGEAFRIAVATTDLNAGIELALAKIDYDMRLADLYTRHAERLQRIVDKEAKPS